MTIGIIGLGLIGGSFAKAIKKYTEHTVFAYDKSAEALGKAISDNVIYGILDEQKMGECDIIIAALYPNDVIDFAKKYAGKFRKGAIFLDCCGIKRKVCGILSDLSRDYGFNFVGGHPMAGREFSGYENSSEKLFSGASMILCPDGITKRDVVETLRELCLSLGFCTITLSNAKEHDKIIAYTSQLAHIVSSAYIKSEMSNRYKGYSAGSFKDMTRVAFLNEKMWTELFFDNKDNLINEIDILKDHLNEYSEALKNEDRKAMETLLAEGKNKKLLSEKGN